jgi:hypothetical protein
LVRIDPAAVYEFKGHLQPGSGVAQAYLRISWYASSDASGQAIATDDSTQKLTGPVPAYTLLTTGPRTPPAGARSARVRAMLSPAGAAAATLYLDDFAFGVAPPQATSPPASTVAAPDEPFEAPGNAASSGTPQVTRPGATTTTRSQTTAPGTGTLAVTRSPTVIRESAPQVVLTLTPALAGNAISELGQAPRSGRPIAEMTVIAGILFVTALVGAYVIGKRPRGA